MVKVIDPHEVTSETFTQIRALLDEKQEMGAAISMIVNHAQHVSPTQLETLRACVRHIATEAQVIRHIAVDVVAKGVER